MRNYNATENIQGHNQTKHVPTRGDQTLKHKFSDFKAQKVRLAWCPEMQFNQS